jgi:hypothetical protein
MSLPMPPPLTVRQASLSAHAVHSFLLHSFPIRSHDATIARTITASGGMHSALSQYMQSTHPITGISLEDLHDPESTTAALMRLAPRRSATIAAADVDQFTLLQHVLRITLTLAVMLAMSTLFAAQVYFTLR